MSGQAAGPHEQEHPWAPTARGDTGMERSGEEGGMALAAEAARSKEEGRRRRRMSGGN